MQAVPGLLIDLQICERLSYIIHMQHANRQDMSLVGAWQDPLAGPPVNHFYHNDYYRYVM